MAGYWRQPDDTAETLKNSWLHTGDIAVMDEEGFFFIVDRKKDLIITGGENIAPREIEEALYQHPKVLEAAAAGIPHRFGGEIAKAWIVLRPGETATRRDISKWLEGRLAHYKIPRAIEFRDALPKSPMGKVLRRQLVDDEIAAKNDREKQSRASDKE
ncbi:MAG TPA: long-chain fatty acid--CoA ligase, partial [Chloroflexota bacterium]|nr:long-chain fatty acid--CoA ligase [Chloroflexota bacterium]